VYAVKLARDIFATRAFSTWVKQELMPGPDVHGHSGLRDWVRRNADSYHHQVGSCKMGSDDMSVVDPQLRVYGVKGLRIADASVMPVVPSGNCHAGILMIAERCADMLKDDYDLHTEEQKKKKKK
jgi:choline dehydrogenase